MDIWSTLILSKPSIVRYTEGGSGPKIAILQNRFLVTPTGPTDAIMVPEDEGIEEVVVTVAEDVVTEIDR